VPIGRLRSLKIVEDISRMKFQISNEETGKFDILLARLDKEMAEAARGDV